VAKATSIVHRTMQEVSDSKKMFSRISHCRA